MTVLQGLTTDDPLGLGSLLQVLANQDKRSIDFLFTGIEHKWVGDKCRPSLSQLLIELLFIMCLYLYVFHILFLNLPD